MRHDINLPRRLRLDATLNTRDLGGYMAEDGTITDYKKIIRSDVPSNLTPHDKELLKNYHITTVIDLRGETHFLEEKNWFVDCTDVSFHNIPMLGGFKELQNINSDTSVNSYELLAELHGEALFEIFEVISNHKEGCLFINCKAGKDRTGMISAMILMLCGISYADIVADYEISYTLNRSKFKFNAEIARTAYYLSPPENMWNYIDYINHTHGGIQNYLKKLGISEEKIAAIKHLLLPK